MKTTLPIPRRFTMASRLPSALIGATLGLLLLSGCVEESKKAPPSPGKKLPPAKQVKVGKNVYLEVQGKARRVIVHASVCMQKGQLELLLTRKRSKEHEAILAADVDARDIHKALLLAGAREGSPVSYAPTYKPATGQTIKVTLAYGLKGKVHRDSARSWIRNIKTRKELSSHWVFAGSRLVPNNLDPTKPKIYLANDGDVICVSNFESALLDLPIQSPKDNADLVFETSPRVPPVDTKVRVILEPVPDKKK